ncbi:MAG: acetolactate decarboxylase [Candidatus Promineifilaceae bacterium]|nr:acetolactate decarboxylase [Candidatus Promineifilaceae bacterium]
MIRKNSIYLCAPVNALVEGIYEEKIPFTQIKRHGDFGLGTFDHLDGEMIMLDGRIYQIDWDGCVQEVDEQALTPFACVTFFKPQRTFTANQEMSYEQFLAWIQSYMPSPNIFYAFHIEGSFATIKARSVPRTENYRPLATVAEKQHVFEFSALEGTLAGFYTPDFMSSLSVPGFHLHFLSTDKKKGGHLLTCRPQEVKLSLQAIDHLELALPMSWDYLHLDFHRDTDKDLDIIERAD